MCKVRDDLMRERLEIVQVRGNESPNQKDGNENRK